MSSTSELLRQFELYSPGSFVLISLNPSISVAPLEDNDADDAASRISTKKYLAWVSHHKVGNHYGKMTPGLSLFVVSRQPPSSDEFPHLDERAFLPLWPAIHPDGRDALRPTRDLPWPNCIQSCRPPLTFSIGIEHRANPSHIKLPSSAPQRMLKQISDDRERMEASLRNSTDQEADLEPPHADHESEELQEVIDFASVLDSDSISESIGLDAEEETLLEILLESVGAAPPKADIWLDLSLAGEIGEPEDLRKEIKQIRSIEEVAKQKIEADLKDIAQKKAQKLEWIKRATQAVEAQINDTASVHTVAASPGSPTDMDRVHSVESHLRATAPVSGQSGLSPPRFIIISVSRALWRAILRCLGHRSKRLRPEDSLA